MINLKDMNLTEMEAFISDIGEKKFRARQVLSWIYKGVVSFSEMTDLAKPLRDKLCQMKENGDISLGCLDVIKVQESQKDGTRKYLFGLSDGNTVESVFMKYKYGNSICVSSQAGCSMGCRFCASGIGGLVRDLTPGEMVDQVLSVQRDTGERINHIVVMGTGEPFDNYDNLAKFLCLANWEKGLGIGMRGITVSTCGIVPGIGRFAEDFPQANLAISLHASNDEERSWLMPVNRAYSIGRLLSACWEYVEMTGRRITFEYTLVKSVNDTKEKAEELAELLTGLLCHVNLIPLNKVTETGLDGTDKESAAMFMEVLASKGIAVTIRRELGTDIDAACGQLRLGGK